MKNAYELDHFKLIVKTIPFSTSHSMSPNQESGIDYDYIAMEESNSAISNENNSLK